MDVGPYQGIKYVYVEVFNKCFYIEKFIYDILFYNQLVQGGKNN